MKRFLLFVAMLFISLGIFAQYVDLGLPSGNLWSIKNEGGDYARYTYDEAVSKFGNKLPTKVQLDELKNQCTWTWTGSGHKVVGPNGNSIYLPAVGLRGCDGRVFSVGSEGYYWSSTPIGSFANFLGSDSGSVYMGIYDPCDGLSVRLVASSSTKYVDLGLPSGTLWYAQNEGDDYAHYTYDEAVSKFGEKLPTKEQLEELKNQCTWTWTGSGYKVVGPNGNSIYLPAAGYRSCDGNVYRVGPYGLYWSSTPLGFGDAFSLDFYSDEVGMDNSARCLGQSVRLVLD